MELYDFALWLGFPEEGAAVMRDVPPAPQEARELLERFDRDEKEFLRPCALCRARSGRLCGF